ncbi:MAG: molybdopterin-dependent oxidoreductase [Ktedonobacteraceae bacterium]|nr:molybdopterin-dependent oxidoreductase [Ktedonobacteraceae bacterium]
MDTFSFSIKKRFGTGFQAGLAAGLVAGLIMLILSWTINGISLPEVVSAAFTALLPVSAFDYLHQIIGENAKYYLFAGIFLGQCLVFALCGGLYNLLPGSPGQAGAAPLRLGTARGVLLALVLWLLSGLVLLPLLGAGVFGVNLGNGVGSTMISLALVGLIFGLLFVVVRNWLVDRSLQVVGKDNLPGERARQERRSILQRGLVLLGVAVLGIAAWRFITGGDNGTSANLANQLVQQYRRKVAPPVPNYGTIQPAPHLSTEITPNDQFYVVSKNLASDPTVNVGNWHLDISGEVAQPLTLTYADLLAMPMKKQYESMMCISNEVGGRYMSNALWEGISLATLLEKAGGPAKAATKVVLHAADSYSDSIPLAKALEPTTLIALRMNGAVLPQGHGYPARLLVPGIYGMKHVKWITRIEVVKDNYQGYWQQRGWSDAAPIRLTSRIDTPLASTTLALNRPTYIAGVAFSGDKGIGEVDVSVDAGKTWQKATLKRPLSPLTWVLWEWPWIPQEKGNYTIVARAIDMEGNVQTPAIASPLPDGATGYHTITVVVV